MKKDFLKKTEFKIFFTVYIVYLVFISNYGGNYMADSMLTGTISLVEKQTLAIDDYVSDVCKKTGCDHAYYKGHFYSGFAPGPTSLAAPIYLIAYQFLDNFLPETLFNNTKTEIKLIILNILVTILIASLLSALTSVLIYKISSYFTENENTKIFVSLALSFSTLFLLYSTGYYARILASFFSIFAFYKLIKIKHKGINKKDLFLAGLSSSVAISMDYPHFIISFVLFCYLLTFLRDKRIFYFIAASILPVILILGYHYIIFGNIFQTPEHLRANIENMEGLSKGFGGFNYPHLDKLFLYLFSPERGVFFYNPIFLLSLYGIFFGIKKNKFEMLTILFVTILTYLFYSSSVWPWWWDGSYGPRYLLVMFPFLILPLNFVLEKVNKFLIYMLLSISFIFSLFGAMFDRTGFWTYPFDILNPIFNSYLPLFLSRGFSNYTLNIISYRLYELPVYLINLIFFIEIFFIIFLIKFIWSRNDSNL